MALNHLRVVKRTDIAREVWDAAAERFQSAWLWHRWDAIDAYAAWENTSDRSIAILDASDGNRVAAILPLYEIGARLPLLRRLESTGGPALDDCLSPGQRRNVELAIRNTLLGIADRRGAHRIDLSLPPLAPAYRPGSGTVLNPLALIGCRDMSTQSWILDLRDADEGHLWKQVDHRVRKAVKKARAGGIRHRPSTAADLDNYITLHHETCRRNRIPPKPTAYFRTIFEGFQPRGEACIMAALDTAGRPIAFHVFAVCKSAALYWTVCSAEEALHSGANDLLQWEAMRHFLSLGIDFYETGEAFPAATDGKLRRISDFKKGFGGDLHPYFRGRLVSRPVVSSGVDFLRALRDAAGAAHGS